MGCSFYYEHSGRSCGYNVNSVSPGSDEVSLYCMVRFYVGEGIRCAGTIIAAVNQNIPDLIP